MNTITAQFHTIIDNPSFERRVFWGLICMLAISIAVYGFFLGKTVVSVIERKVAEMEVSKIASAISSVEAEYLSLSSGIDLHSAGSYGFVESKKTAYVVSGGSRHSVALRP